MQFLFGFAKSCLIRYLIYYPTRNYTGGIGGIGGSGGMDSYLWQPSHKPE